MKTKKSFFTLLLLLSGSVLFAAKGLIVVQKYHTGKTDEQVTVTWYVTNTQCKLKMQFGDKEIQPLNTYFLADIKSGNLYTYSDGVVVTGGSKTYYSIPVQQIKSSVATATVERTGTIKNIQGFNCEKMIVTSAGQQTEMWVTKDFPIDLYRYSNFFKNSIELQGLAASSIQGVPLVSSTKNNLGNIAKGYELVSVTSADIPDSEFTLPADYKSAEEVSKQKK